MITFIIPAYNAEKTIKRAVESILHQTDDRYRIIIVNDGSTDQTEKICKEYERQYSDKLQYVYQSNRGVGGARNHGLDMVKTEYVAFLDSDDWLMPQYVEKIMDQLDLHICEYPEIIVTLPIIYHEGSGLTRNWYDKELFEQIFQEDGDIVNPQRDPRIYQFEVNLCRKVLNMAYIRKTQFRLQENRKWEDIVPHFFLLSKCKTCMGIRSTGFYYRIGNADQITNIRGKERLDILIAFNELKEFVMQEERKDLEFFAMRVWVRLSVWCIRKIDVENRKKMVMHIHIFFKKLPPKFYHSLKRGCRVYYSRADRMQYQLFVTAIRYRVFNWVFHDYLYQQIGEKTIKKILKAKEYVA